ncbi:MAG: Imm1 family immunity protein [Actinocatenispora sp.]
MTTFTVAWGRDDTQPDGQHSVQVSTVAELDDVLDRIEATGAAFAVDIYRTDDPHEIPYGLQLGVGHQHRPFLLYAGDAPAGGLGVDTAVEEWPEDIEFDTGGEPTGYGPDRTRVTAEQARHAAGEYVTTGRRPTTGTWN